MTERVLVVDDDVNILNFAKRALGRYFECVTADSAAGALEILRQEEPVAVIVSDDNMPGIRGTQLLAEARKISPDTTRIMLTGYADQQIAVDAVNEGAVFRFLNKPIRLKTLTEVVELGVRQYQLVTAERQLLNHTLRGTVRTLSDLLGLTSPELYGRTARLRRLVGLLAPQLSHVAGWELETAVALARIGHACSQSGIDDDTDLEDPAVRRLAEDTEAAAVVISRIPRLESIAGGIRYQFKNFDGSGFPGDGLSGKKIPLLGRVLRLASKWDDLEVGGHGARAVAERLRSTPGIVDPDLLEQLAAAMEAEETATVRCVTLDELADDAILADDIESAQGTLLVARGHQVDELLRRRLRALEEAGIIGASIRVCASGPVDEPVLRGTG